jgi:Ferroportin1 (FPN1)
MPTAREPAREADDLEPTCSRLHNPKEEHTYQNRQSRALSRPTPINRQLYISHFLSTSHVRGFEFRAVLFPVKIILAASLPTSVYAFVRAACAIFLSPIAGRYIGSENYLKGHSGPDLNISWRTPSIYQ